MIDDLIDRRIDEAHELNFGDGLHALRGHADAHTGDHVPRRAAYSRAARRRAPRISPRSRVHAAALADVFAEHDHARIVLELPEPAPSRWPRSWRDLRFHAAEASSRAHDKKMRQLENSQTDF